MKLKQEELRKQERNNTQINEITEGDLIQAFGVTKDQMEKAAAMLGKSKKNEKSGNSLAWLAKDYGSENTDATVQKKKRYYFL